MSKPFALKLCTIALLALFAATAGEAAAQTTRTVDDDGVQCPTPNFNTIQAAVDASAPNDIIVVCAGTYAEQVNVNKTLTLRGTQVGIDARDPSRSGMTPTAAESVVTGNAGSTSFNITANDVIIDGFIVQGATNQNLFGFGILIGTGTAGARIRNNIIQNNIAGISLANNNAANQAVIRRNLFRDNNQPGPVSGTGIYTDQFNAGGPLANVLIDNNTFTGNQGPAINFASTSPGSQTNLTVSDNIITDNGNGVLFSSTVGAVVRRNTITGSVGSQVGIFDGSSGITVTENFIEDGDARGFRVADFGGGANTDITANCNSIENNALAGLEITDTASYTGQLDARFIYWGSPTGPTIASNPGGTGDEIVDPDGEVIYRPFLTSDADANPTAPGFQCANTATAGSVIISEFRQRGPAPNAGQNEFVEIYNRSDSPILVADAAPGGGPEGWALVSSENPTMAKFVVPAGTIIPARGHFLAVNSNGYSLSAYPSSCPCTPTAGDLTYTVNIPDGSGLALFRTADSAAFGTAGNRLDAVGFAVSGVGFSEGTPLSPAGGITDNSEHSFVRKMTATVPQDTENNETDFAFVATDGAIHSGRQSTLGAPGPENLSSPIARNDKIKPSLFDPGASSTAVPNRERRSTIVPNGAAGELFIRRQFTNNTGQAVTRLRFRVVDITTLNSPGYTPGGPQADLRALTSTDEMISTSGGPMTAQGLTLEQPPAQPIGGGLNSSLSNNDITLATPLAPGGSVKVAFRLGVMQPGNFRFIISVEALRDDELSQPAPPPAAATSFRARKSAGKGANAGAAGKGSSSKR